MFYLPMQGSAVELGWPCGSNGPSQIAQKILDELGRSSSTARPTAIELWTRADTQFGSHRDCGLQLDQRCTESSETAGDD